MSVANMLYAGGLVVGLVLIVLVGVVAARHRETPGALPLFVIAVGGTVWGGSVLVMVLAESTAVSRLANAVMYAGIVTLVAAWLAFALDYTGRGDLLTRRTVGLLAVEPVLILLAIATNPVHQLFWRSFVADPTTLSGLETAHGPLFWVHAVYSYVLILVGSALLVKFIVGERTVYRQQAAALLVAVVVPWAANVLYVLEVVEPDLTPLGFAFSGAALAWAMLRADFVQLAPVAREAVVETMSSGVFVVDRSGRLADINPAGRRMVDAEDASVVGRDAEDLLARRPELPDSVEAMADTEITVDGGDAPRHFEIEVSPVHDARDRRLGRLVVAREVTQRREREEELRRKNQRLDQFAGVVSHDLRNPLSVAASYVELAKESGDVADLEKALEATDRMETIIDDVLALAREDEDVQPDGRYDLGDLAESAWETVDTDDATLVLDDPPSVEANRSRLRRAFENLFRNAVEHGSRSARQAGDAVEQGGSTTDGGHDDAEQEDEPTVTVTVGSLPDGDGFYVADDGPGIPPDKREAVLAPGESSSGGTGLGLAIVDTIADGHGWELSVDESDAGGARFEVRGVS